MKLFRMNPFITLCLVFSILCGCSSFHSAEASGRSDWINWEENKIMSLLNNVFSITNDPCSKDTLLTIIDAITGGTGTLYIPMEFSHYFSIQRTTINITGITISGLETITEATLFEAKNKYQLFNHFKFGYLRLFVEGDAKKREVTAKKPYYVEATETFSYNASVVDPSLNLTVLLGVSSELLGGLYMDQLSAGCIASAIEKVNVTSHDFSSTSHSCSCDETETSTKGSLFMCSGAISSQVCPSSTTGKVQVEDSTEPSTDSSLVTTSMIEKVMKNSFGSPLDLALTEIEKRFASAALNLLTPEYILNSAVDEIMTLAIPSLSSMLGNCSAHVPHSHGSPPDSYANFMSEDTVWSKIVAMTSSLDVAAIDASIACATKESSGTAGMIAILGELFEIDVRNTQIKISDLVIKGLNSINQLLPLQPVDEYNLETSLGIDHLVVELGLDVSDSAVAQNGVSPDIFSGEYEVIFNMTEFKLMLSSFIQLDLSKVSDLTIGQLKTRGCIMSSFDAFQLTELIVHMRHGYLSIMPTSTSSSVLSSLLSASYANDYSGPHSDVDNFILACLTLYIQALSNDYDYVHQSNEGFYPEISLPSLGNGFTIDLASELDKLLNRSGSLIDRFVIDNMLANSNATCHNESTASTKSTDDDATKLPSFDDEQVDVDVAAWEIGMGMISFVVMSIVIALSAYFSWIARTNRRQKAEARGRGHLGNEFVVVHADDVLGGDDEYLKLDGVGDDDDESAANVDVKANVADSLVHGNQDKNGMVDGDHLTPGKHLDENGNEIDEYDVVDSLFQSKRIGTGYKYGIPGCCFAVVCLFISANVFNGAAVYASVEVLGLEPVETADFFDFTLQNSVHDFWEAKVYFLSVLVALLSGAVPYLKLILIGVCWMIPIKRGYRQFVFTWVDALGKWSLLDSYVLVAMMVAFNFKIYLGPTHTGHDEPIKITVYTKPEYGFYAFLVATMCSMALGHAATFFHRFDSSPVERIPAGGPTESLSSHFYSPAIAIKAEKEMKKKQKEIRNNKRNASNDFNPIYEDLVNNDGIDESIDTHVYEREKPTMIIKYSITFVILATFGVLMAGGFTDSFKFSFGGLTGYILKTIAGPGSTSVSNHYSLVSAYDDLPDAYPEQNDLGIWFIQQAYLLYGFWVPALHLCLLLVIWLVPLTLRTQATALALGEIANAWSAVDVFIFSIFAALLQISKFAAFIVEGLCGSPVDALGGQTLNQVIGHFFNSHNIDEAHTCLDVQAALLTKGAVPLFVAGASVFLTSQLVLSYAKAAVHDRIDHLVPTGLKMRRESLIQQSSLKNSMIKTDLMDVDASQPVAAEETNRQTRQGLV